MKPTRYRGCGGLFVSAISPERERGDKVDLPIHNKEEQKRDYEEALVILQRTVAQERSLTMGMPRFVGAVRVVPAHQADAVVEMVEDPDIELVGMEVTMDYEQEQGRVPEDVATQNLGFDVRSTDPETDQKRYIEVKARSKVGPVALTQNEWFKASRFGSEFYLYVVLDAATQPELYIIQDPAANLQPQERVEVPNPLPPALPWTPELVTLLSKAHRQPRLLRRRDPAHA
jgi:hypothetical protein